MLQLKKQMLRKTMRKFELQTAVSTVLAIIAGAVPLIIVPPFGDTCICQS